MDVNMKSRSLVTPCCTPLIEASVPDAAAVELAEGFAALGDPTRLRILGLVATAAGGEICVCDLIEPVGKSQPTVSHHLRVLSDAGLVVSEKRGRWAWYSVVPDALARLRGALATE
jgi:ArsR family transcriptional regulator, arsenate/arsenite/antimonite-responsive transcriptional repressor